MINYKMSNNNSTTLVAHVDVCDIMNVLSEYEIKDVIEYPYYEGYKDEFIKYINMIAKVTNKLDSVVVHVSIKGILSKCEQHNIATDKALFIYTSLSHLFLSAAESLDITVHMQIR